MTEHAVADKQAPRDAASLYMWATVIDITILLCAYAGLVMLVELLFLPSGESYLGISDLADVIERTVLILAMWFHEFCAGSLGTRILKVKYTRRLTFGIAARKNILLALAVAIGLFTPMIYWCFVPGQGKPYLAEHVWLYYFQIICPVLLLTIDMFFGLGLRIAGICLVRLQ